MGPVVSPGGDSTTHPLAGSWGDFRRRVSQKLQGGGVRHTHSEDKCRRWEDLAEIDLSIKYRRIDLRLF